MHYDLSNGIVVKSENAALTTKQTNKVVIDYISLLPENIIALDYGCGKLRHSIPLYKRVKNLVVIDSQIQIDRVQHIDGIKTTIREYIGKFLPTADVYPVNSGEWIIKKYDFILCSNVLSSIPNIDERLLVLKNIKKVIKPGGKALISVQYRNSYFKTYANNPNASQFLDGWLIKNINYYTFYGIITPDKLVEICLKSDLLIRNKRLIDGSVYLEISTPE